MGSIQETVNLVDAQMDTAERVTLPPCENHHIKGIETSRKKKKTQVRILDRADSLFFIFVDFTFVYGSNSGV